MLSTFCLERALKCLFLKKNTIRYRLHKVGHLLYPASGLGTLEQELLKLGIFLGLISCPSPYVFTSRLSGLVDGGQAGICLRGTQLDTQVYDQA